MFNANEYDIFSVKSILDKYPDFVLERGQYINVHSKTLNDPIPIEGWSGLYLKSVKDLIQEILIPKKKTVKKII